MSCVLVSPALQRLNEGVWSLLNGLSVLVPSFSSLHVIQICLYKTLSPAPSASVCVIGKTVKADWTDSEIKCKEGFMSNTKGKVRGSRDPQEGGEMDTMLHFVHATPYCQTRTLRGTRTCPGNLYIHTDKEMKTQEKVGAGLH